jgi:hypothetical protein
MCIYIYILDISNLRVITIEWLTRLKLDCIICIQICCSRVVTHFVMKMLLPLQPQEFGFIKPLKILISP